MKIIEYCNRHNIYYVSSITTNGYLLTYATAKKLSNLKVHSCQLTIDGPKHIHDNRRKLTSGAGSFDKIFQNLLDTKNIISYSLRVNYR